jgi:Flp pilus assembly protein TadG
MSERAGKRRHGSERGVSLVLVALGLILLLATAGIAVDLATLYVARNEAQRAADAAALAGADKFVGTDVSSGLMTPLEAEPLAAEHAAEVGNDNLIIGRNPDLSATNFNSACPPPTTGSGGCFNFSIPNDPQVTVVVQKSMPTYFMRFFGIKSVPVSVTATAEAYIPEGAVGPTSTVQCLKPWLLPNCDPYHQVPSADANANTLCPANSSGTEDYAYFVNPTTGAIVNPGLTPDGVVGESLTIKPGNPSSSSISAPSQFWPVFLPSNGTFTCPACASADKTSSTSNSASLYRENIECCSTTSITCGTATVDPISGDMTGPTGQGVDCLIHEGNSGTGQDTISLQNSFTTPFIMYAGSNNPYYPAGTQISTSDSLVTLPLYDGQVLCPGNSCPTSVSVDITGFLQLFISSEGSPQHSVYAYILSIASCVGGSDADGGGGTGTPIPAVGGSPVTVRLIHN